MRENHVKHKKKGLLENVKCSSKLVLRIVDIFLPSFSCMIWLPWPKLPWDGCCLTYSPSPLSSPSLSLGFPILPLFPLSLASITCLIWNTLKACFFCPLNWDCISVSLKEKWNNKAKLESDFWHQTIRITILLSTMSFEDQYISTYPKIQYMCISALIFLFNILRSDMRALPMAEGQVSPSRHEKSRIHGPVMLAWPSPGMLPGRLVSGRHQPKNNLSVYQPNHTTWRLQCYQPSSFFLIFLIFHFYPFFFFLFIVTFFLLAVALL